MPPLALEVIGPFVMLVALAVWGARGLSRQRVVLGKASAEGRAAKWAGGFLMAALPVAVAIWTFLVVSGQVREWSPSDRGNHFSVVALACFIGGLLLANCFLRQPKAGPAPR